MMVACVDVPAVDPEALLGWAVTMLKLGQSPQEEIDAATYVLRGMVPPARKWVGDFGRAGGRALFAVVSSDLATPPMVVVPIDRRTNATAMRELLKAPFGVPLVSGHLPLPGQPGPGVPYGYHVERIADALVLGNPATLKKGLELSKLPARPPRPELTSALAEAGGTVRVAFAMTESLRAPVRAIGPTLPAELGGVPTATLTDKLQWVALSFDAPSGRRNEATIRITCRTTDAPAADHLKAFIAAVFRTTVNDGDLAGHPDKDKVLALVEPRTEGTTVEVRLDPAELKTAAVILGPLAIRAREKGARAESETRLKLLAAAIRNYAGEFGGRLPQSTQDPQFLKYLGTTPGEQQAALVNPVSPAQGYTFVKPRTAGVNPSQVLLIYEGYSKWPTTGIRAAFADGRVGVIKTEDELKALVRGSTGR